MTFALFDQYSQYMVGLGAVLALIGGLTWVVQKVSPFGLKEKGRRDKTSLHLLSTLQLDPKRRLVVIEFNNRKHLILLGQSSELLIESEDLVGTLASDTSSSSDRPYSGAESYAPHLSKDQALHLRHVRAPKDQEQSPQMRAGAQHSTQGPSPEMRAHAPLPKELRL